MVSHFPPLSPETVAAFNFDRSLAEGYGVTENYEERYGVTVRTSGYGMTAEATVRPELAQGHKYDAGKPRLGLIPLAALEGTARALGYGADKYDRDNWRKGISWERVYSAMQRHLAAWFAGEDADPESGLSHLDHAGACLAFLQHYTEHHRDFDDRPPARVEP